MAKLGRPTKYKPEMCDTVIELMSEGASHIEVMAELGIWEEAFYNYIKKHEDFAQAVKKGQQKSAAWWERKGRVNLENGQFSYTGWYMNMKNRFGWADKKDVHNTGDLQINVVTGISRAPGDND